MEVTANGLGTATLPQSRPDGEQVAGPNAGTPATGSAAPPHSAVGDWAKWLLTGDNADAPPGAPPLESPNGQFNADDLVILITALQAKVSKLQMATSKAEIKVSDQQKQAAHKDVIAKIREAADKIAEAKKKEKTMRILTIVAKSLALVAAIAATALTAGAAAPFAVAILAYMVVDMGFTIASEVNQSNGGENCDLDYLMAKSIAEDAKANGASEEEAQKIGQWATFSIQLAIALATLATGVGAASAVKNGAEMAIKLSSTTVKATRAVQVGATVASGADQVASGTVGYYKAVDEKDAEYAKAEKMDLDKKIMLLTQLMQNEMDRLKKLVEDLDDSYQQSAGIIAATAQSRMQPIKNMA